MVKSTFDLQLLEGDWEPSPAIKFHAGIYKSRPDVKSVIHSHPVYATMFAIARRPIPPCIDEFSIYVGGEVPVTEYAMSGTEGVGENAVAVLANRGAALLANHGMVAVGPSPATVLHITALVERSAKIVWGAMVMGKLHALPPDVDEKFAGIYSFLRQNPM